MLRSTSYGDQEEDFLEEMAFDLVCKLVLGLSYRERKHKASRWENMEHDDRSLNIFKNSTYNTNKGEVG